MFSSKTYYEKKENNSSFNFPFQNTVRLCQCKSYNAILRLNSLSSGTTRSYIAIFY